jgi:hypothetical protein
MTGDAPGASSGSQEIVKTKTDSYVNPESVQAKGFWVNIFRKNSSEMLTHILEQHCLSFERRRRTREGVCQKQQAKVIYGRIVFEGRNLELDPNKQRSATAYTSKRRANATNWISAKKQTLSFSVRIANRFGCFRCQDQDFDRLCAYGKTINTQCFSTGRVYKGLILWISEYNDTCFLND